VSNAVAVDAGDFHACALIAGGTVKCWGVSAGGALGDGTIALRYSAPVNVIGVAHATAVEVGGSACALIADGSLYCWGNNSRGQLGVGTTTSQYATAVRVHSVRDAVAVGVGTNHSCAALATGNIKCWGENLWAQLGRGTVSLAGTTPALVRGLNGSAAGAFRSCGTVRAGGAFRLFAAGRASCTRARGVFRRYHAVRARRHVKGWRCATSGRSVRCRRGGTAPAPAAQVGWTRA
jgi:alpha-tubulin suppressor-like RCC1 family protein